MSGVQKGRELWVKTAREGEGISVLAGVHLSPSLPAVRTSQAPQIAFPFPLEPLPCRLDLAKRMQHGTKIPGLVSPCAQKVDFDLILRDLNNAHFAQL